MKKILLAAVVLVSSAFVQQSIIAELVSALKAGDAPKLSAYFNNTVSITMPDKSDVYPKEKAAAIMKDFFAVNEVKDFSIIHKGDNNGSQFFIGTLQTKKGNYRTTIFLKNKGDKQLLQEIKLEQ